MRAFVLNPGLFFSSFSRVASWPAASALLLVFALLISGPVHAQFETSDYGSLSAQAAATDVLQAMQSAIDKMSVFQGFSSTRSSSTDGRDILRVFYPDGNPAFSVEPESGTLGKVYHAKDAQGNLIATYQLSADNRSLKMFDASGKLVQAQTLNENSSDVLENKTADAGRKSKS